MKRFPNRPQFTVTPAQLAAIIREGREHANRTRNPGGLRAELEKFSGQWPRDRRSK